jgi:hypothetical protein
MIDDAGVGAIPQALALERDLQPGRYVLPQVIITPVG